MIHPDCLDGHLIQLQKLAPTHIRELEKIGASQEGFIRKHMIRPDGSNRNSFLYGLTDEDWFLTAKQSLQNRVVEAIILHKAPQKLRKDDELVAF